MKPQYKYVIGLALLLVLTFLAFRSLGSYGQETVSVLAEIGEDTLSSEDIQAQTAAATGMSLGLISILPIIITVALAFITKEVVFSLFVGLFSGLVILEGAFGSGSFLARLGSVFSSLCGSIIDTATNSFHGAIIILCLCIGGMVEVINASGGFAALGKVITRNINTPKRAALMAQLMGMSLFFDDYANSLITGPVMRHITDRQGVSREKLAYIVDSTAAPVAGIAIISSWIAAELSAIESGFEYAGVQGSAYEHFFASIPFCFYNFAALALVLATTLFGKEYGPMLMAERRARAGFPLRPGSASIAEENATGANLKPGSIWSALLPVLTLIIYAFVGFYISGIKSAVEQGLLPENLGFSFYYLSTAFGNADTVRILMEASILASLVALVCAWISGRLSLVSSFSSWLSGMSGIMLTAVILVLAWSLSAVVGQLGTAYYLVDLVTLNLPVQLLPMLIFITCCTISFGAGSFGCMMIVMPIAVPIAYSAVDVSGVSYGDQLIFASIAAVLSGSIFGDHCSPVTDTTILSSLGAGCDNLDHVKTQLPYALTAAAIVSILGYLPAGFGVSPAISTPLSIGAGVLAVGFLGKKVDSIPKNAI